MHESEQITEARYKAWRATKLSAYPRLANEAIVTIPEPDKVTDKDIRCLFDVLSKANWVIYQSQQKRWSKDDVIQFSHEFGLNEFDCHLYGNQGVSDIRVSENTRQGEFIPYTSRGLRWHTDGYYNPNQHWVTAIVLHCNSPAAEGGMSQLVDPDLLYIYLRDLDMAYIDALMKDDCLYIPGYDDGKGHQRPASSGPVFWFNNEGYLQMRYTQRTTNISWSEDPLLTEARELIQNWLTESEFVMTHQLQAGQGILSANVLHNRSAFEDHPDRPRHMLRARYLDSIHINEEINHD